MVIFLHPRIRIVIVLGISLAISGLLMNYTTETTEIGTPTIEFRSIASDFTKSISNSKTSFLASIQSIKMPSFQGNVPISTTEPTPPSTQDQPMQGWDTVPTGIPTSTPAVLPSPTSKTNTPTLPPNRQPTATRPVPTTAPQPTKAPTPTKVPKPTATPAPPPITTDLRPGSSIEEILREVSKRACIPYALLMATRTEESGAWMNNMNASVTKYYNTYGWWKTAGKGEVCYALAYYTQSGKIPPDSTTALQEGTTCNNGVQPGAYDQKIMGLMQMSEEEEKVTRKYTSPSLPKSIDRRVLFDNALIYAFATKNRLGSVPKSCDDWPEDAVKAVAEKHYGACAYPGGNYCNEIWNYYKKFQ